MWMESLYFVNPNVFLFFLDRKKIIGVSPVCECLLDCILTVLKVGHDSTEQRSAADALGFRPKNVTQEMVDTVSNMFPDIPPDNIRYNLLRTGSVELTTNKILERGFLDAPPPAYHTLYPRNPDPPRAAQPNLLAVPGLPKKGSESLISRYRLQDRVKQDEEIREEELGGKAVWEDSAEKREASLKERKAKMILAARQRLLAQQEKDKEAAANGKTS
ncbi:hypothetical protein M413DRAFT_443507 [Hebeloma cylindrosporum]|uniref:CUE domain-containing protein n=1 Tax=Hebeloma cylindrosporum TaxID=76867 RepID=A0A0C2YRF7_HEBCY|nr:hypothetical protein M413DRAFT_443507 [Hebeloma cylindrosporum h7]